MEKRYERTKQDEHFRKLSHFEHGNVIIRQKHKRE